MSAPAPTICNFRPAAARQLADVKVEGGSDMVNLLSKTINQIGRGVIGPRVANEAESS